MTNIIQKLLTIFDPTKTVTLEATELWEVRWTGRTGAYHSSMKPEVQVFTSEPDARIFAAALKQAFALVRHTGEGTRVYVEYRP